jgi:ubiquinone/menaquinone biosynthesis C-methylase UbiE
MSDQRAAGGTGRPGKSPDELRTIYDDAASRFERFDWFGHRLVGGYRRRLFERARGRVLDVACGTGANFRYVPPECDLVGVDLSEEMLDAAAREAERVERDVTLQQADATELPFPDDSFETVISSLSTCTFPDPVAVLREMGRVCAPDGRILLLEHGRSSVGPIAGVQDRLAPRHFDSMGCRWNQEPASLVEEAGLRIGAIERDLLGVLTSMVVVPGAVDGGGAVGEDGDGAAGESGQ